MNIVRPMILLGLLLGCLGSGFVGAQTPEGTPVTVPTVPTAAPGPIPSTGPVTVPVEVAQPAVVTSAPVVSAPVAATPLVVSEAGAPACTASCPAETSGKCQTCNNCTVVETTKKKNGKEIHSKCKDICWPCSYPLHHIMALICHEKPEYVCKGRTIHVQMKKVTKKDVSITVCKTPEQIAKDAKKDSTSTAPVIPIPIRRSGL